LKLIGGATNAILSVPLAIGGIIGNVLTQGNSASNTDTIDRQEGGKECWCESDQAPFAVNERRRAASSNIVNRIVNRPMCKDGEEMVCRDREENEEVDTAPLTQEPVCSCNGELNNERLGVQPCESSFQDAPWCYVEDDGRCRDEITSDTTGKSWSQDACGLDQHSNNKETNGVNPIVPRLQLQME
jgi:hypothetical protein